MASCGSVILTQKEGEAEDQKFKAILSYITTFFLGGGVDFRNKVSL